MHEIEVKVLGINKPALLKKLAALKAKRILKPTLITELAFRRANDQKFLLRLRSVGKTNELTFKQDLRKAGDAFKTEREIETTVADFDTTRALLEQLGFTVFRHREKMREEFKLGNVKIEIDTYPECPPYMEIEGDKSAITAALKKLGYGLEDSSSDTATQVLKKLGKDPSYLLFKK
jgi:adenylate cyclase class 2